MREIGSRAPDFEWISITRGEHSAHLGLSGSPTLVYKDWRIFTAGPLRYRAADLFKAFSSGNQLSVQVLKNYLPDGNGILFATNVTTGFVAAYATQLSLPQLYVSEKDGGIFISTALPDLIRSLGVAELAENAWLKHLLFHALPDGHSWFKNIIRLPPGFRMLWSPHSELCLEPAAPAIDSSIDHEIRDNLVQLLDSTIADLLEPVRQGHASCFTYLSGGMDSALVHYLAQKTLGREIPANTVLLDDPLFLLEEHSASEAGGLLKSAHQLVKVTAEEYPEQIDATVRGIAQPPTHWYVLLWTLASRLPKHEHLIGLDGGGANSLLGMPAVLTYDLLDALHTRNIKAEQLTEAEILAVSKEIGTTLSGPPEICKAEWTNWYRAGLRSFEMPDSLNNPLNYFATEDRGFVVNYFDLRAIGDILRERREWSRRFFEGRSLSECLHVLYLTGAAHHFASQCYEIGAANGIHVIKPFFDDGIVRACFRIPPSERLRRGDTYKPLVVDALRAFGLGRLVRRSPIQSWFFPEQEKILTKWMLSGPLRDYINEMERPSFLDAKGFAILRAKGGRLLFKCVIFDRFKKAISAMVTR